MFLKDPKLSESFYRSWEEPEVLRWEEAVWFLKDLLWFNISMEVLFLETKFEPVLEEVDCRADNLNIFS